MVPTPNTEQNFEIGGLGQRALKKGDASMGSYDDNNVMLKDQVPNNQAYENPETLVEGQKQSSVVRGEETGGARITDVKSPGGADPLVLPADPPHSGFSTR